jgi:hypothetical protein
LPKQRNIPPDIDPRLEPFLEALAELIARQVLREMEDENKDRSGNVKSRNMRPQGNRTKRKQDLAKKS